MNTPSQDVDLIVRAAWMYHVDGMTHTQIARRLFVSRQTVGRLVDVARSMGIVRIEIDASRLSALELSGQLRDRLRLADAIVTPGDIGMTPGRVNERVAAAVAAYTRRYLHPGATIGVGWGDTVARSLTMLSEDSLEGVLIASAAGSIQAITELFSGSALIASRLRVVPAPLILSSPAVAAALRDEAIVRSVLDLAASAVVTLTGIGSAHPTDASAVRSGVLTAQEVSHFVTLGAVGDMLGEWFDIRGRVISEATSERRIGLPLETLRTMSNVVAVAGGLHKVDAIIGAAAGRFMKVLITDEPTAHALLEAVPPPRTRQTPRRVKK